MSSPDTRPIYEDLVEITDPAILDVASSASGPSGALPLTHEMLTQWPSGDLFGLSQNTGMGWNPEDSARDPVLILSTQGGLRAADGSPIALGYHTGHWEISELVKECAEELKSLGMVPFAGMVSDPCDGRTQGTVGMFDSLPYRNDAAVVLRRLIRSLPKRKGVIGIATCDKGLPAMMMALVGTRDLPVVLVPGGVTLPPRTGEDAGKIQTIGARYSHGEISLEDAADLGCRACATPGGGCQFLGTAATAQVIAETLGLALPHSALAPSGQLIWREIARRSARAVVSQVRRGLTCKDIVNVGSIANTVSVHAAFGGSLNLLIHIPAIAFAGDLPRPTLEEWRQFNLHVPRMVSVLPNGPENHPTVRVFLAGGVPEVMYHLREIGLLDDTALCASGERLDKMLKWWIRCERRKRLRELLFTRDGIDPDDVISPPALAKKRGMHPTATFPSGNIAPDGAVIKSTAIDPSLLDAYGVYHHVGPARVFTTERDAIAAIKSRGKSRIKEGDVIVLMGRGPLGSGMEETYQLTSALKFLPFGKHVALVTDARFSGVSTGACLGHVSPEALAGGPIGRVRDGDLIRIEIDTKLLVGKVDMVGMNGEETGPERGTKILSMRKPNKELQPDPLLPADTRLWAALQDVSGGLWQGCVYDVEAILKTLEIGKLAIAEGWTREGPPPGLTRTSAGDKVSRDMDARHHHGPGPRR